MCYNSLEPLTYIVLQKKNYSWLVKDDKGDFIQEGLPQGRPDSGGERLHSTLKIPRTSGDCSMVRSYKMAVLLLSVIPCLTKPCFTQMTIQILLIIGYLPMCLSLALAVISLVTDESTWHQLPLRMVASYPNREDCCHVLPPICHTWWGVAPGPFVSVS